MCAISHRRADDPDLVLTLGSPFGGAEYGRIGHPKPIGEDAFLPNVFILCICDQIPSLEQ